MRPGDGTNRKMDSAWILLPAADSPTTPTASPGAHLVRNAGDSFERSFFGHEVGLEIVDA